MTEFNRVEERFLKGCSGNPILDAGTGRIRAFPREHLCQCVSNRDPNPWILWRGKIVGWFWPGSGDFMPVSGLAVYQPEQFSGQSGLFTGS